MGAIHTDLDCLLKESDFVIVNCSLTPETKCIFNKEKFSLMKPTAIFVNTARGGVVDHDDLVEALQNKVIGGAGLDCMHPEPIPTDHPLTKLDNCVLLPHIGSATIAARTAMGVLAAQNLLAALDDKEMPAEVKV
nr:glyoxylate reductase/hydroxypyruvate reductase-like [Halyomorpha halys]